MNREAYISQVLKRFGSDRFSPEVERDVQQWLVEEQYAGEKEQALFQYWETLPASMDQYAYKSLRIVNNKIGFKQRSIAGSRWWKGIAAVVVPLTVLWMVYYLNRGEEVSLVEHHVPPGQQMEVTLADGTDIWVNAGSTISYAEAFDGKERVVTLAGEAFFSVERDTSKPFIIKTAHLQVWVLGTELNVKAYPREDRSIVTLSRGSVRVIAPGDRSYLLEPDYRLVYRHSTGQATLEQTRAGDASSWRDEHLVFDNASFPEILSEIGRRFDLEVDTDPALRPGGRYSIKFIHRESPEQILPVLEELIGGFTSEIRQQTIYLRRSGEEAPEEPAGTLPEENPTGEISATPGEVISYLGLFQRIETQAGVTVAYDQSALDPTRTVTLTQPSYTLSQLLEELFINNGFAVRRRDTHLLIRLIPVQETPEEEAVIAEIPKAPKPPRAPETPKPPKAVEPPKAATPAEKEPAREEPAAPTKPKEETETSPAVSLPATGQQNDHHRWALKMNLLYRATSSLNLAAEYALNTRWSIELLAGYNPWDFRNNGKLRHLLIQPEVRYWTRGVFDGHFFGLHLHYADYEIAGVGLTRHMVRRRYDGDLFGAGLSWGYHLSLSRRWGAEATAGIGYARASHDIYHKRTGEFLERDTYHYFGPTRLGLSLVYYLK